MKTLSESLFDKDLDKSELTLHEAYEWCTEPHRNSISNDIYHVLDMFNFDKISKEKFPYKVSRTDNSFMVYWNGPGMGDRVGLLMDLIMNMPAEYLTLPRNKYEKIKEYFSPFLTKEAKKINIYVRQWRQFHTLMICDDLSLSMPSHIDLTFKDKS